MQTWQLHVFPVDPMNLNFPYARSLIVVRSQRTRKKTGETTLESRYYLSSAAPQEYTPLQWLERIRGHWAGIENRNHWRRDALLGEDRSRSRHAQLLANVALMRDALLAVLAEDLEDQSLPAPLETLRADPARAFALLTRS